MPAGRPTKYKPEYPLQAAKLCALGATHEAIADFFEVDVATVYRWENDHPEFCDAIKEAKDTLDAQVERSLFQRAMGYSHPEVHISNYKGEITETDITKHYPPDATSMIFWLKNRQPAKWRDKQEHEVSGKNGGPLVAVIKDA